MLCCSRSVPQPIDSHWSNNPVRMRLPPGGVPASYPQIKLPVLDNPALFEKLDTEALFFAFYYMPGTHQQYLAARELKRQSWRYHKQHGAWFQVCMLHTSWHVLHSLANHWWHCSAAAQQLLLSCHAGLAQTVLCICHGYLRTALSSMCICSASEVMQQRLWP